MVTITPSLRTIATTSFASTALDSDVADSPCAVTFFGYYKKVVRFLLPFCFVAGFALTTFARVQISAVCFVRALLTHLLHEWIVAVVMGFDWTSRYRP